MSDLNDKFTFNWEKNFSNPIKVLDNLENFSNIEKENEYLTLGVYRMGQ